MIVCGLGAQPIISMFRVDNQIRLQTFLTSLLPFFVAWKRVNSASSPMQAWPCRSRRTMSFSLVPHLKELHEGIGISFQFTNHDCDTAASQGRSGHCQHFHVPHEQLVFEILSY